jgi:hypothetical protein
LPLLSERTGNPAVPDQELIDAQQTIAGTRDSSSLDPDEVIFRLAALALRRKPLTATKASVAATIAVVWARIGRRPESLALATGIDDPNRRIDALSGVATALAGAGQADQALQVVAGIADLERRIDAFSGVATALGRAGQSERALQVVADIADPEGRAHALSEVAQVLARPATQSER